MKFNSKYILLLYRIPASDDYMRVAVRQHLHALDGYRRNYKLLYYNAVLGIPSWLSFLRLDAIILHPTFLCARWRPNFLRIKEKGEWIRDYPCIKIAIPQDEYDHSAVLDEWLADWKVSVILTCFDEKARKLLYPRMHQKAKYIKCLTGYIDEAAAENIRKKLLPLDRRPFDIVYRAAHLPYWFGSHGQLKNRIGVQFEEWARVNGLRFDISTSAKDTIVGNGWLDFLASGRCVIGCESGSSVLDSRGEIQKKIQKLLKTNPTHSFEEVSAKMPEGWDSQTFFALSPRHFEAVITKTCQILVEGNYDGILKPDRHYIPIRRDYSNLDEILKKIKDIDYLQNMADCAYQDIYLSGKYSYRRFAEELEEILCLETYQGCALFWPELMWLLGKGAGQASNSFIGVAASLYSRMRQSKGTQ